MSQDVIISLCIFPSEVLNVAIWEIVLLTNLLAW